MKKYFLLFFVFLINFSFSQEEDVYNLDYNNSQKAIEICTELKGSSFMSNAEADNALGKILSVVGAAKRFIIAPCEDINNAVALVDDGIRYIIYDPVFINSISNDSNYWSNMSILAHEVGHHINGHTLSFTISATENKIEELEADKFSGFVMAKLGATLEQATEAIAAISEPGDDTYSSHPSRERRIRAITQGFNNAINNRIISEEKLDDYEAFFHRAYEKDENGDYEGAIEDYTESIKLKPLAITYTNRGLAKNSIDDYAGAIIDFRRASEIDPTYRMGLYNLGRNLYLNEDYWGAISEFEKFYSLNLVNQTYDYYDLYALYYTVKSFFNKNIYDRSLIGIDLIFNGDYDLEYLLEDAEYIDDFYTSAGIVFEDIDSLDVALDFYTKSVEINPNDAFNVEKVGDIFLKKEKYDTAIEYYNKALELDIDKSSVYQYRAYAYEGKNDIFSAIFDMNEAIKLDPEYGFYYYERGRFKKILNQNDYCQDWVLAYENGYDVRENLIEECNFTKEDFYNSEDYFDSAITFYNEGDNEKAIRFFEKARELGYDSNLINTWLVYANISLGNLDLAENILKTITESDFNDEAWELKAAYEIAIDKNDYQLAIERFLNYENYMQINPFDENKDSEYINENFEEIVEKYRDLLFFSIEVNNINDQINFSEKIIEISKTTNYNSGKDVGHYYLANAKIELEDYYSAMQEINESIKINPDDYYNLKLRAEIKLKLGAIPSACEDLKSIKLLADIEQDQTIEIDMLISENCN